MDTRRDIEHDMWCRDHEYWCGTCVFHSRANDDGDRVCENSHSDNYGVWTDYEDGCNEWIGR